MGPWIQGTVAGHGSDDHPRRNHRIRVSELSCIIARANRHVTTIPFIVEEYLRNEVAKKNKTLGTNRLNEAMDNYEKPHGNEMPHQEE